MRGLVTLLLASVFAATAYCQGAAPKPGSYWKTPTIGKRDKAFAGRVHLRYSSTQGTAGLPTWLLRDDNGATDDYNTRRVRVSYCDELADDLLYFAQVRRDWGADEFEFDDLYLTWARPGFGNITIGQGMVPFGREFMSPDALLPIAERPLAETLLIPEREIGLLLFNNKAGDRLGWYAGTYLGRGKNDWSTGAKMMAAARIEYLVAPSLNIGAQWVSHPGTVKSNFQRFLSRNGAAYGLQPLYAAASVNETAWGLDALYRSGPTSVWAGYTSKEASGGGVDVTANSWYLDLGQYVPFRGRRDALELCLGYQVFDPNTAVTDQLDARWLTFGANYHIEANKRQVRLQYAIRDEGALDLENNTIMLEYDHAF